MDLHELMQLDDYKKLTKIRLKNYIFILRMITEIDKSAETYEEVKLKLYQVKPLSEYLSLKCEVLYRTLRANKPIADLEAEEEEAKKKEDEEKKKEEEA